MIKRDDTGQAVCLFWACGQSPLDALTDSSPGQLVLPG
jgi:uncharacterized protein YcsI (UPF0317 family)